MSTQRRKALVTGAGRNIGRAIALRLARSGCDVVIHTRADRAQAESVADAARAHGVEALVCLGDIGSRDDLRQVADCALERFGHIDVLVNVAAIRPDHSFLTMRFEDWQHVMDANVSSVFHLTQACLPGMVERRWGRIINLTGMNSIRGYAKRTHNAASKHAVWGLTKALARELGPHNITVNAISPGPIQSEHEDQAFDERIKAQRSEIPLGRLGSADEIGALAAFLASDEGGFMTGQMIGANGGAET
jgi:3-oxoacyl-[acyl-carrier protein] reductase